MPIQALSSSVTEQCNKLSHTVISLTPRNAPRRKNGFITATKLGTTDKIFVAVTKRFVDGTKHFVVVTKCFCYPDFKK